MLKEQPNQKYTPFQMQYLNCLKWTETIALMLGFLEISDNQAEQLVKLALNVDFALGARLAGEVKIEAQEKTVKLVEKQETTALVKVSLLEKTQSIQAINGLGDALNYPELNVRQRSAWALRKMPWNVVFSLLETALKDLNPKVRENVIWALGESKIEYAIPILNIVLERDSSADVRLRAVYALQEFTNEEAILSLLEATQDSDRNVKNMAVYALEKVERPKLIIILDRALNKEDILIKVAAIKMFERLGTQIVIPYLYKAQLDLNQKVHLEAKRSLQSVKKEMASQVQKKIESARTSQEAQSQREAEKCIADLEATDRIRRGNAIQSLVRFIGKDAISIVIKALDDRDGYVQFSACNVLASRMIRQFPEEIGVFRKAVPKLIEILNKDEYPIPHSEAASVLGQLGDKNACSSLSKAMKYENSSTRRNAIEASVKLGCQGVELELLRLLKDSDFLVQSFAVKALGEIQYKQSIPELISLLEDADIFVQYSVAEALGQFQGDIAADYLPKLVELIATNAGEQVLLAIAAIQLRCGFYNYQLYQQAQEVNDLKFINDNFIETFYQDLDKIIYYIQENPELRKNDQEDRLTIDIVGQLRSLGYKAEHDIKIGGHVDITVRKDNFIWLGEAKIYNNNNNYLWEGFQQLTTRYSTGDNNQNQGGLLIYIFEEDAKSVMESWQGYLQDKNLSDYTCKPDKMRNLSFVSSHRHERSGQPFYVRHIPILLHFDPKDKSGRSRKKTS